MDMKMGLSALKSFYIMQILLERTDEAHSLNATQIRDILENVYGVKIDRHTLYTEIEKLSNAGLDIIKIESKTNGYYVASRQFELPELKLLVDAVQSSRFITERKSRDLIEKLETLCSKEEAKQLDGQVVVYNRPKTANETIYYNVDKLHTAIFHNLQIKFQYVEWTVQKKQEFRHGGAFYTVSPLHLVWDDENYYLIAFDENAKQTKHFRVDKMRNMEILEEKRSPESAGDKTDLAGFSKKTFGMFGGTDTKVRLKCKNHLAGVVIDRFGSDVWMVPQDQDHFAATVTITVSPQFFGWVTAIGEDMEIDGPEDVKAQYEQYLERLLFKYRKKETDI